MPYTMIQRAAWAAWPEEFNNPVELTSPLPPRFRLSPDPDLDNLRHVLRGILERNNYWRITLTLWRMPNFEKMTSENRTSIKTIRLNLDISGNIIACSSRTIFVPTQYDSIIILKSFHDLLHILSTFNSDQELRLEIDIHSKYGRDYPGEIFSSEYDLFFDEQCASAWWQSLPEAPAVRSLHIPIKDRERWSPEIVDNMRSRFPNLTHIYFKPDDNIALEREPISSDYYGIDPNPENSGESYSNAVSYYANTEKEFCWIPRFQALFRGKVDPSLSLEEEFELWASLGCPGLDSPTNIPTLEEVSEEESDEDSEEDSEEVSEEDSEEVSEEDSEEESDEESDE
ncbi:hypothetical protein F5Y16DRAFT_404464 [Xylariaceae sp. FL0255]|nr:hypothetical protein F5Y16DRAFT_404464 [Xylariaceae sp. FL0255]